MGMDRPNVIYVLADDMGIGDISSFNPQCAFQTPNYDRMAARGMRFTDAHATAAVCTPSRYSLMTGRYNWRSGKKYGVNNGYDMTMIEPGRMTVASMLKANGYATAAIGKWHIGMDFSKLPSYRSRNDFEMQTGIDFSGPVRNTPIDCGFDYFFGISGSLDMPPYVYVENDHVTAPPDRCTQNMDGKAFWRYGPTGADFSHVEVLPKFTGIVLDRIERYSRRNEPFFIYYPMPAPHAPLLPAPEFIGRSGTNLYGDFVLMCDHILGTIMDKVDSLGIAENTIVIFASDNGCARTVGLEELARCGHDPSGVYRGYKADIYEGGHRVPLIVQWPARIKGGQVCDRTVCLCDLFATLAELLHWQIPADAAEDSVSNLPLWFDADGPQVREDLVHQSVDGSLSIRIGKYKLEMCPGSGGWSYPVPGEEPPGAPPYQLYDLDTDVGETDNIIDRHPELAETMRAKLLERILAGRSTPGPAGRNTDRDLWESVRWAEQTARPRR